jgi:hypothetical protein
MDANRVAEVFTRRNDSRQNGYGSGYLVAPNLVLTAGHLVDEPLDGNSFQVRLLGEEWVSASMLWKGQSDLALLEVRSIDRPLPYQQWGELGYSRRRVRCTGAGFPRVQAHMKKDRTSIRDIERIEGFIDPITGRKEGLLTIHLEGSGPISEKQGPSPWAGMSGAAIFCGSLLVGVVTSDPHGFDQKRLKATPISSAAADQEFASIAAPADGSLDVRLVHDIRDCVRRQRFDSLLQRHAAGFGGREGSLQYLTEFLADSARRCLIISAPAGYGKTALLARLVGSSECRYPYHFFDQGDPTSVSERDALASLVEQLMALAGEEGDVKTDDVSWLQGQLNQLARAQNGEEHTIILDGLDEPTWNVMSFVEAILSKGVRLLVSQRWTGRESLAVRSGSPEIFHLDGFGHDDIRSVLKAVGVPIETIDGSRVVDDIARIARGQEPEFEGADPFVVRFIAEDLVAGRVDAQHLQDRAAGLSEYLDDWYREIRESAAISTSTLWLIRLLAVAKGSLSQADLEALIPVGADVVLRPTFREIITPVHRHLVEETDGTYRLAHHRLAEFVRGQVDEETDRRRLIEYCARWRTTHSDYALRFLVTHLIEVSEDLAIWELLSESPGDLGNPWYRAHLRYSSTVTGGTDRLRWYLADLDALARHADNLRPTDRRMATLQLFRAAALMSTVTSASGRAPGSLLRLMVKEGGELSSLAVTLALQKPHPVDRAQALVSVVAALEESEQRRELAREALSAIIALTPNWRDGLLKELSRSLDATVSREAMSLVMRAGATSPPEDLGAVSWLAERLPEDERAAVGDEFRRLAAQLTNPVDRAYLLISATHLDTNADDEGLQLADDLLFGALEELPASKPPSKKLLETLLAFAAVEQPDDPEILLELVGRLEPADRPQYLYQLLAVGGDNVVIPCVNMLLELESSEERGRALSFAIPKLSEEDAKAVARGVDWDWKEFAVIVPSLPESIRTQSASKLFGFVSDFDVDPTNAAETAEVISAIVEFLPESQHAKAIGVLAQCVERVPLVPPADELARMAGEMLRIRDPQGRQVEIVISTDPSKGDVLSLLATADSMHRREHIYDALQAVQAIDDLRPTARLLADLAMLAQDEDTRDTLLDEALKRALEIDWDPVRQATLWSIAPQLTPNLRLRALEALDAFEIDRFRDELRLMLLAQDRPVPDEVIRSLPDAVPTLGSTEFPDLWLSVADALPQDVIEQIFDRSLVGDKDEDEDHAEMLLSTMAERRMVNIDQVWRFVGAEREVSIKLLDELMSALDAAGREQLAQTIVKNANQASEPSIRVLMSSILLRANLTGLNREEVEQALQAGLAQLDLDATPTSLLVTLAETLPNIDYKGVSLRDAVLSRHRSISIDERARFVEGMAAIAPPEMLLDLLDSLKPVRSTRRVPPLKSLAVEFVGRTDQEAVWQAWRAVLQMSCNDSRRDFFEQIRSCLPLAIELGGVGFEVELAQSILRITTCFP